MPVKVFCQCGREVTDDISVYDTKTRTVYWMDKNAPLCAVCRRRASRSAANKAALAAVPRVDARKKVSGL